ncbi:Uncharacterised protein [Mycobacteroides abscessus subsp. abscessus]|nr:Uncharacterised protein [Mycobacteroides abscessus subsp. abscessus]
MRLDEIDDALLDMRPQGGRAAPRRIRAGFRLRKTFRSTHIGDGHDDRQIEGLGARRSDNSGGGAAGQKPRDFCGGLHRRRKANSLCQLRKPFVQALQ